MKKVFWGVVAAPMLLLLVLALGGCASVPTGPSVLALPGDGKTLEQFQSEDLACRHWADQQLGISPQGVANQNTAAGAVAGTAIGAALGAAIGAASGDAGIGAAIGAASGLLFGTSAGSETGWVSGMNAQKRYDIAYQQCMYSKGNQIPGAHVHRSVREAAPPPPAPGYDSVPPDNAPASPR